jgi:hypothetical protein
MCYMYHIDSRGLTPYPHTTKLIPKQQNLLPQHLHHVFERYRRLLHPCLSELVCRFGGEYRVALTLETFVLRLVSGYVQDVHTLPPYYI